MEILYVQSAFKVFRITLQIMITTYIVGIVFYIFADLVLENKLSKIEEGDDRPDTFIETFDLEEHNSPECLLTIFYFMFTTLSTVGLGDLHPRANSERLFVCAILFLGVMIFSYFMGNFVDIIKDIQSLDVNFDDGDQLSKFFGLLKYLNGSIDINQKLKNEIEEFFDYSW